MPSVYIVGVISIAVVLVYDLWFIVDYQLAADIALTALAVVTTAFVILYGVRSNWRANRVGRIFFVKAVVLPMVLWSAIASVWTDYSYPWREHVRFVIYAVAAVAYAAMVILLVQQQRGDRRRVEDELRRLGEEHDPP